MILPLDFDTQYDNKRNIDIQHKKVQKVDLEFILAFTIKCFC